MEVDINDQRKKFQAMSDEMKILNEQEPNLTPDEKILRILELKRKIYGVGNVPVEPAVQELIQQRQNEREAYARENNKDGVKLLLSVTVQKENDVTNQLLKRITFKNVKYLKLWIAEIPGEIPLIHEVTFDTPSESIVDFGEILTELYTIERLSLKGVMAKYFLLATINNIDIGGADFKLDKTDSRLRGLNTPRVDNLCYRANPEATFELTFIDK